MLITAENARRGGRPWWRDQLSDGTQGGRSLDASKIEAAYIGFMTAFNNRLKKGPTLYPRLATVARTKNLVDRQLWLSNVPKMRRWIGDKHLNKLRGESHPIVTSPHEASLEVPKHDILNDQLGLYSDKINQMADAYGWAIDDLVIAMLCAGVAGTALGACYDGQNLIDTDHTYLSVGGAAQSNKVTGALDATTYATAWERYLQLQDENGVPINVAAGKKMMLCVGPANRQQARLILEQQFLTGASQNIDAGTADLIVTPWITPRTTNVLGTNVTLTGNEWFLIPEGSAAVLVHDKRDVEFLSVEDGEYVFRTGKFLYGIEAEFGAAYGLWQEVVGGPGV